MEASSKSLDLFLRSIRPPPQDMSGPFSICPSSHQPVPRLGWGLGGRRTAVLPPSLPQGPQQTQAVEAQSCSHCWVPCHAPPP